MEERDRSRSPSRRTSRVEQVVGRWLRRSRDLGSRSHSLTRERVTADGKTVESGVCDQRNYPFRFTVQIQREPAGPTTHGFILSLETPILVQDVTPGGPADGRLVPGDRLVKVNNVAVDDLTPEQAAEIIRECQDTVTVTVLRIMVGPKSSFITPEKRAKLRSNPVKVHFAEEVEVNGHSQGNSLLFLPNVLKVYLENGQTKAFKFEPNTTVKDIVMTLKEKLSLSRIENFSLVLEQQYSITKLLLLHEEERIQQVVQKREAHDYRCLFRVCFMPKDPRDLLLDDPTAFEYYYLQGVNDVLQERFAVEMRCNTALRLAALQIQERLASCGQSQKTNLKTITKTWGIENFVSCTLLRNMREKDLKKAIGYHMKKIQSQQDPKQKGLSANQARINYLEELSELKSFGGKSFSATMMLQDRESMVTLLVGARYGVSQVVNHKLSIMTKLTEFTHITRIELLPESDKVSLVKIYLQDIKPITLLLESTAAKDLACLIAGYCHVCVDPNLNIFPWTDDRKKHKVSTEEGYVSRCGSDSDSSDMDMTAPSTLLSRDVKPRPRIRSSSDPDGRKRKDKKDRRQKEPSIVAKGAKPKKEANDKEEKDAGTEKEKSPPSKDTEKQRREEGDRKEKVEEETGTRTERVRESGQIQIKTTDSESGGQRVKGGGEKERGEGEDTAGGEETRDTAEEQPSMSETSDSFRSDSRFLTSPSSDSLDALEEDDLVSCSSSLRPKADSYPQTLHPYHCCPQQLHLYPPTPPHSPAGYRLSGDGADPHLLSSPLTTLNDNERPSIDPSSDDKELRFVELSRLVDYLPSPPEASDEDDLEEELRRRRRMEVDESIWAVGEGGDDDGDESAAGETVSLTPRRPSPSPCSSTSRVDFVFNFDQSDARCYYKLCTNVTPDSARSLSEAVPHTGGGEASEACTKADDCRDVKAVEPLTILQPPPGFGDSSSDEEFFDARDRFASPEDPTSGAVPRDFSAEMKPEPPRTLSLSDIGISVTGPEKEAKDEGESVRDEEEGGGRETLFQLRRRSRKRRSFVDTGFTSTVSYPEPGIDSNQDSASNRIHKSLLAHTVDRQALSSPESSEETQNPCTTVSSLSRSEGEPAQLECKPIMSKTRSHGPASQTGDVEPRPSARVRKQDMEMEPDAMESKSVADSVKEVSCQITAVRCRVEPDGKESADRRGDGKEEGEEGEQVGEKKEEEEEESDGNKEEVTAVSWNGPFMTHVFLADIVEEESRGEDAEEEEEKEEEKRRPVPSSELRPLVCFERATDVNAKRGNVSFNSQASSPEKVLYERVLHMVDESVDSRIRRPSHSPPPPPTSPLPPLPLANKSPNDQSVSSDGGTPTRTSVSICSDSPDQHTGRDNYEQIRVEVRSNNEDETISVFGSATTSSDDVVYSANSDNVFEDIYETGNSLHSGFRDSAAKDSVRADTDVPPANVTCNANVTLKKLPTIIISSSSSTSKIVKSTTNAVTTPIVDTSSNVISPMAEATNEGKLDTYNTSSTKTNIVHDISKEYQSPTHFLFQTYSPNIMGRLSTSTIRDKIQRLPLYLPRSQEAFNQTGIGNIAQSPSPEFIIDDTEISVKLTHDDIIQSKDTEMNTVSESAESDDSDSTVTGSDAEADIVVEAASAEITRSTMSEVNETFEKVVIRGSDPWHQSEHHTQPIYPGLNKDTPGPILKPPSYRIGQDHGLKMFHSGSKMDVPGPIREAPESKMKPGSPKSDVPGSKTCSPSSPSIPSPIVVTTQNLNRPGIPFLSDSEKQCHTSSDRLALTRLCGPAGESSDLFERQSTGCGVFTTCQDQPQSKTPAQLGPTLKPDYGCSSVLAAGCESVMEGIQTPLDACGCPEVYTNCLSRGDSFDDELTVYEFSCHTQSSGVTPTSGMGLPLTAAPCVSSFLSTSPPVFPSASLSPSFPRSTPFSASNSELSPLLSPLSDASDCYPSSTHKDTISHLRVRRYPTPPAGFQTLRSDVDQLLSVLEGLGGAASAKGRGGRHPRDTCPAHFTENKRVLHTEARRLMAGCQKVVGVGQSPEDMLFCLADSFRTLVELAGVCLWFSGCDRCDRRNAEAIAGLIDVARSFTDFCLAAERASGKRSCQDLSTKLLAKQCTALTASVFCLTQLFRTLTAL